MRQQMDVNLLGIDFTSNLGYPGNLQDMSLESLNFFTSSPVLDDFFETIPEDVILENDFDIFERVGHEFYELTDSFMSPLEHYGNEWVGSEWIKSDEEELYEEILNSPNIDVLLGEDCELNLLDFIIGDSQVPTCDVYPDLQGLESMTAFGLLDELEKGLTNETCKQEKEESEETIIKSVKSLGNQTLELQKSISKEPENNNANNLTKNLCSSKAKQNPKTSKVKPKSKGINKGGGGKYRPQKANCQSQSNESHQVMAEHDYVLRDTNMGSSTTGVGKVGTVSRLNHNPKLRNKECKEARESNTSSQNTNPAEKMFISALDAKVAPKPKHAPIPRKDASTSGPNLKPKPAPVPRKSNSFQDQTLEQKHRLAPVPRKDVKFEQNPKPALIQRKMTSILDNSKLIKSIREQDDCDKLAKVEEKCVQYSEEHKSANMSLGCSPTSQNNSPKHSPDYSENNRCSSVEDLSTGDLQQNENADGRDKNKKKLSLVDYKKLKQERFKQPETDKPSKTNEMSIEGDHNYCRPSQYLPSDLETSDRIVTEKPKAIATATVVNKPTSPCNVEVESQKLSHSNQANVTVPKVEHNSSRITEPVRNQPSFTRTSRDPNRRFEDNNFRKRRASPLHNPEVIKRTMRDEPQYSNNSWNTSVLTVFELPRRNSKYSHSAGFPSDTSSLSSPCQRSRSRSSSVSSTSSSSSVSSSSSKQRHSKKTRSQEEDSRERRDGSRKSFDQQKAIEERRIVYIGGLPSDYTKYDLKRKMQRFGDIIETSIHRRNKNEYYGFVTFEKTAQAANAKQDGQKVPGCERFDFSYGGRREFCGTNYSDLDHEAVYRSSSSKNSQNSDFQDLLRQTMSMVQKSKRTS